MQTATGTSALVVPVAAADAVVGECRGRFDPSAAAGMPAHLTLVYPFLPADAFDDGVADQLRRVCAEQPRIRARFDRFGRFPGVLYLAPDQPAWFVALIDRVVAAWPETPPYAGAFTEIVPHLTIASGIDDELADVIERDLARSLPIVADLAEAALYVVSEDRWLVRASFPFGDPLAGRWS